MSHSITDLLQNRSEGSSRTAGAMGSFVKGTVTENNSSKFPGMIKAEFTSWTSGKNICEWIPVLRPYSGDQYGCYVMPEIGDIVLIGFLGSTQNKPVVLGMLDPSGSAFAKDSFDDKNLKKRFKTKGGIDITANDEKDKQSLTAVTPKGLTISAQDENEIISVSDKDAKNQISIDCKNGQIQITAAKKLMIQVGKCELSIDGDGGSITVKGNQITLDAGQTAKIAGKQSLALEGGMLKAEGKQTAELKGGTMTQVSGQVLKLN